MTTLRSVKEWLGRSAFGEGIIVSPSGSTFNEGMTSCCHSTFIERITISSDRSTFSEGMTVSPSRSTFNEKND